MVENDRLVEGVCLSVECMYSDGINHTFKFFLSENDSNNMITYIVSLLPAERIINFNLNVAPIGLVYTSSLYDVIHVKQIIDNEFLGDYSLKMK